LAVKISFDQRPFKSAMTPPQLLTEINEQPAVLARLLDAESANIQRIADKINRAGIQYITIAARGTSDNAATYAKYVFAAFNRLPVALATPSLYTVYKTPPRLAGSLVIGISQSGQSPDIVAVVEEARKQNVPTLAITNFENSPLARAADDLILQHAGEEKTIAATKTYTTQLLALAMLSTALINDSARRNEIEKIPEAVARTLSLHDAAELAASRWAIATTCLVIGRGFNYTTAYEIALKFKELAYVTAEPFSSADFLHGPIAVVQGGYPVLFIAPRGQVFDDLLGVAQQLKQRGADLVMISDNANALALSRAPLALPMSLPEWLSPMIAVIPGQLMAYHLTSVKGYDPDHPRGLTKVTKTL
jgi:glucosamine--fructose-6-phosphate aminotransferase (isomerizing)